MTWHNRSLRSVARQKSPGMGVLEDWPRPREQNFVALALALAMLSSNTSLPNS